MGKLAGKVAIITGASQGMGEAHAKAFVEAGDPFDAEVAARLKQCIYSRGDSVEPGATYRAFRGRDAQIEPMLRDRGLI